MSMRWKAVGLAAACLLILSGCVRYPERTADGTAWDESWLMHGSVLGVEAPEGVVLVEDWSVLTMEGISASVWGVGTPDPPADDGDEEGRYPALVYVLLRECADEDEARQTVEGWRTRLGEIWSVTDERTETHLGQTYAVLSCESSSADGPYVRETAASACRGASAVSVEVDCRASFSGDPDAVLSGFLDGCHYAADP